MYLGDETLFISAILCSSALMLLVAFGVSASLGARLRSPILRLNSVWRTRCAFTALALIVVYVLRDQDLAARIWVWVAVGIVTAILCTKGEPRARGWVLRASWVIMTWQALVGAKFTVLPVPSPTAVLEASRLLVFNFCQSLLYPLILLSNHFALPGVLPFLDRIITKASEFGTISLVVSVATTNICVVWLFDRFVSDGESREQKVAPSKGKPNLRLLVVAIAFCAISVASVWLTGGEAPSMWLSGLILLLLMLAPVIVAELPSGQGQRHRWANMGLLQIVFGGVALIELWPDWLRLLGILCVFSGMAIVSWRGAALAFVRPDGRIRGALVSLCLLLWFVVPAILIAICIMGCLDIFFDIRALISRAHQRTVASSLGSTRQVFLWTVIGTTPALLWCGVVIVSAWATGRTTTIGSLSAHTAVLDSVPADPWEMTERVCVARGQRPCTADEVVCDPELCGDRFARQLSDERALICYPDDQGLGRLFSEIAGWTPQWRERIGTLPRQFSFPQGARPEITFPSHRLLIFCCQQGNQEVIQP